MDTTDHVKNILEVLALATPAEIVSGGNWYREARELAAELSSTRDHRPEVTPMQVAGVIAALSPLTPWDRNVLLARQAVENHGLEGGTLGNSVRATNRILAGEDPLAVLKSDKVRNFFLSILGTPDAVCIDRHAWDVYMGVRHTDGVERPSITPKRYREASAAYLTAASRAGLTGTELQAITWVVWRRIHLTGTRWERAL